MIKIFVYGERDKMKNYANALEGCGAQGIFSLDISQAKDCDALLLPGGGDIDPARYGQTLAGSEEPDLQRDAAELHLVSDFTSWGKPILGICRGIQMINVALGGELIQDIPTAAEHRHDPVIGDRTHKVTAEENSFLFSLYGGDSPLSPAGPFRRDLGGEQRPSSGLGADRSRLARGSPFRKRRHRGGGGMAGKTHLRRPVASRADVLRSASRGHCGRPVHF